MAFIELNDITLFYTDEGSGSRTIVFIHGWTCDGHDWMFQHDYFSQRYRVITVDLRGHGRSSVPDSGFSPKDFASDVAQLLSALNVNSVVAVGHSLGGLIIATLAIEHPELVAACIAVDPAYGAGETATSYMASVLDQLKGPDCLNATATAFSAMESDTTPLALRALHRRRVHGVDERVIIATLEGIYWGEGQFGRKAEAERYLAQRDCPVLALHVDPRRSAWEATTFRHPLSLAESFPGHGHWFHQEAFEEFNQYCEAWIAGLPNG